MCQAALPSNSTTRDRTLSEWYSQGAVAARASHRSPLADWYSEPHVAATATQRSPGDWFAGEESVAARATQMSPGEWLAEECGALKRKAPHSEDDDTSTCASIDRQAMSESNSSLATQQSMASRASRQVQQRHDRRHSEQRADGRNSEFFTLTNAVSPPPCHREEEEEEKEETASDEEDYDAKDYDVMCQQTDSLNTRGRSSTVSNWYEPDDAVSDVVISKDGEPIVLTVQCAIVEEDEDELQDDFWGSFEDYCADVSARYSLTGNLHGFSKQKT